MTRQQSTVIWLGLVLVVFNILLHISELKSVIFGSATTAAKKTPAPSTNTTQTPSNVQVQAV